VLVRPEGRVLVICAAPGDTTISDIGRRLAAVSERPGLPWTYHILREASVNAVAAPGGYIFAVERMLGGQPVEVLGQGKGQPVGVLSRGKGQPVTVRYPTGADGQPIMNAYPLTEAGADGSTVPAPRVAIPPFPTATPTPSPSPSPTP